MDGTQVAYSCPYFSSRVLGPDFVARVEGLELSRPLTPELFGHLNGALLRHKVLSFPDQVLSMQGQAQFARAFGELQVHVLNQFHHGSRPDIITISNLDDAGRPEGIIHIHDCLEP